MQVYAQHQNKKVSLCTKESIKGKKEGVTPQLSLRGGGFQNRNSADVPFWSCMADPHMVFYLFYKYTKEILSSCTRLCISTNQDWSRIIS